MTKKIAIISPNRNAYSETFIQAHKNLIKGDIDFLYGDEIPTDSEKNGSLFLFFNRNNYKFKALKILPTFIYDKAIQKKLDAGRYFDYYLKKTKVDVVLAEYGTTGAKILPYCKKNNIPLIVHFHGYDASDINVLKINKGRYLEMFDYAKAIIAVSKVMQQKIKDIGCPKSKIILNTYGPNDTFFNINSTFNKKQFIAIGRFVDKKAPYYTLLAFKQVLQKHPDATLIMAGDGKLLNTVKNLARFFGLSDNVHFPGVITAEVFQNYLKDSCAFVQHSITSDSGDMEGTPVAIIEASAAGLPVISTRHAGIPDVIVDQETGLLVDEHNVDGMVDNMIWILDNFESAKKMGAKGKLQIKNNYTLGKHIGRLQELIGD